MPVQGELHQDERGYADGPVTEVAYIRVEYGHFEEYVAWLTSTWKPTMEAARQAGLIVDYKVGRASPRSPDQPNVWLMITYKDMAAFAGDIGDKAMDLDAVAGKVIGSIKVQNEARVFRNEYRTILGTELIRELVLR
jgi:hypothetical protein